MDSEMTTPGASASNNIILIDDDDDEYCVICQESTHKTNADCIKCKRCGEAGHLRKDCSQVEPKTMNEKDIPSTSKGQVVTVDIRDGGDNSVVNQGAGPSSGMENLTLDLTEHDIPSEFECSVCKKLIKDAVMMPCCRVAICEACRHKALKKDDGSEATADDGNEECLCSFCGASGLLVQDIVPNLRTRRLISHFIEKKVEEYKRKQNENVPSELKCAICKKLMVDAFLLPCCASGICQPCIPLALKDNDESPEGEQEEKNCALCDTPSLMVQDIVRNIRARRLIIQFKQKRNEEDRAKHKSSNDTELVSLKRKATDGMATAEDCNKAPRVFDKNASTSSEGRKMCECKPDGIKCNYCQSMCIIDIASDSESDCQDDDIEILTTPAGPPSKYGPSEGALNLDELPLSPMSPMSPAADQLSTIEAVLPWSPMSPVAEHQGTIEAASPLSPMSPEAEHESSAIASTLSGMKNLDGLSVSDQYLEGKGEKEKASTIETLDEYTMIALQVETIQENNKNEKDIIQIGCTALDHSTKAETKFFKAIQPPKINQYLAMKMKGDLLKYLNIQKNDAGEFEFRRPFEIVQNEKDIVKCTTIENALELFSEYLMQFKNPIVICIDDSSFKMMIEKLEGSGYEETIYSHLKGFCTWRSFLEGASSFYAGLSLEFEEFIDQTDLSMSDNPNALDVSTMVINAIELVKRTSHVQNFHTLMPQVCVPIGMIYAQNPNPTPENNTERPLEFLEISNNWKLSGQIQVEHIDTLDVLSDSEDDSPSNNSASHNYGGLPSSSNDAPKQPKSEDSKICIPCNRTFKTVQALKSHLKDSNKHKNKKDTLKDHLIKFGSRFTMKKVEYIPPHMKKVEYIPPHIRKKLANNQTDHLLAYYRDILLLTPLKEIESQRDLLPLVRAAGESPNVQISTEDWNVMVVQTIRAQFHNLETLEVKLVTLLIFTDMLCKKYVAYELLFEKHIVDDFFYIFSKLHDRADHHIALQSLRNTWSEKCYSRPDGLFSYHTRVLLDARVRLIDPNWHPETGIYGNGNEGSSIDQNTLATQNSVGLVIDERWQTNNPVEENNPEAVDLDFWVNKTLEKEEAVAGADRNDMLKNLNDLTIETSGNQSLTDAPVENNSANILQSDFERQLPEPVPCRRPTGDCERQPPECRRSSGEEYLRKHQRLEEAERRTKDSQASLAVPDNWVQMEIDYRTQAEEQNQFPEAPFQAPQESVVRTIPPSIQSSLKALYFQRETKMLQESNLITSIPKMNKEYLVSFDFKATSVEGFVNIVHFTTFDHNSSTLDHNSSNTGGSIPAVFINNRRLFIGAYVGGSTTKNFNVGYVIPENKWTYVRISQKLVKGRYIFKVHVNGSEVYQTENTTPKEFKCVRVYASNPWHYTLQGSIKNFFLDFLGHTM